MDGELLHISARGSEHVTRGSNRQRVTCTVSTPKACPSEPVPLIITPPPPQGKSSRMYPTLAPDASLDRLTQASILLEVLPPHSPQLHPGWSEGRALEAWPLRPGTYLTRPALSPKTAAFRYCFHAVTLSFMSPMNAFPSDVLHEREKPPVVVA